MLKHPDDLITKLGPLRKKMAIEKASIEAQLRTAIEGQMEDAQKGLDTLLRGEPCLIFERYMIFTLLIVFD